MGNVSILSVIIIAIVNICCRIHAAHVRLTNVACSSENSSWYLIHTCRLKALRRNQVVFNFNATMLYPVHNVDVHVQLVKRANGYKPWLYNMGVNACDFLRKRNHPVLKIIYNIMREYSNLNHSCPYVGHVIVDGLYLQSGAIRLPLPTGEYGVITTWIFDSTMKTYTNVYFEFIED